MTTNISKHPIVAHKMTELRDKNTTAGEFRRLLREITYHLGFEATSAVPIKKSIVTTPLDAEYEGSVVSSKIAVVPVLRAGLEMSNAMLDLLPMASVHHIGMYRSSNALLPIQYYNRLPRNEVCDIAYVLDPCVATSNTLCAVVSILKRWGAKKVVVLSAIASEDGVEALHKKHPDTDIYLGAVDKTLSEDGMIVPGIGDAGDRQFSTPVDAEVDPLPDLCSSPTAKRGRK